MYIKQTLFSLKFGPWCQQYKKGTYFAFWKISISRSPCNFCHLSAAWNGWIRQWFACNCHCDNFCSRLCSEWNQAQCVIFDIQKQYVNNGPNTKYFNVWAYTTYFLLNWIIMYQNTFCSLFKSIHHYLKITFYRKKMTKNVQNFLLWGQYHHLISNAFKISNMPITGATKHTWEAL